MEVDSTDREFKQNIIYMQLREPSPTFKNPLISVICNCQFHQDCVNVCLLSFVFLFLMPWSSLIDNLC
jgi:hypothetical protein